MMFSRPLPRANLLNCGGIVAPGTSVTITLDRCAGLADFRRVSSRSSLFRLTCELGRPERARRTDRRSDRPASCSCVGLAARAGIEKLKNRSARVEIARFGPQTAFDLTPWGSG